ncbi:unnamed protein product [Gadus morhua 'NCC']
MAQQDWIDSFRRSKEENRIDAGPQHGPQGGRHKPHKGKHPVYCHGADYAASAVGHRGEKQPLFPRLFTSSTPPKPPTRACALPTWTGEAVNSVLPSHSH